MTSVMTKVEETTKTSFTTRHSFARSSFGKLILVIVLSVCSYLFFSRLVVTAVEVKGASMSPTLRSGEMFILNRFAYLHRVPQRGELVVLKDPETSELVVKRIVGLPEEAVAMAGDAAVVNGHRLFEPYLARAAKAQVVQPATRTVVPKDHYFVLGDNRRNSADSRSFGPVPRENIVGVINL